MSTFIRNLNCTVTALLSVVMFSLPSVPALAADEAMSRWIERAGAIEPFEMLRTFNCGIGMVLIVAADASREVESRLADAGEACHRIGVIEDARDGEAVRLR